MNRAATVASRSNRHLKIHGRISAAPARQRAAVQQQQWRLFQPGTRLPLPVAMKQGARLIYLAGSQAGVGPHVVRWH
eukprot:COSAG06_NODE_56457_length_284_cov_1.394595_1_plen_76_part_01